MSVLLFAFILSTSGSGICSATLRLVASGTVSDSSLKLASIRISHLLGALVTVWPSGDVTHEGSCAPDSIRESARAE